MPSPPSDPNPAMSVAISSFSQRQEGSLGSLQLSGSRSPGLRSSSGAFQGTGPDRRRKLTQKLWPCTPGPLGPAWAKAEYGCFFFFLVLSKSYLKISQKLTHISNFALQKILNLITG